MDLRDKIIKAVSESIPVQFVRLDEADGISGFIVSPRFQDVSTFDRQSLIEDALGRASNPLTLEEQRHILMIAGLTPEEYEAVGARIRVHRVRERAEGVVEILLRGTISDAEYVRGVLNNQKGVRTTVPKQAPGAVGILTSFRAESTGATPLTKTRVIRVLKGDRYVEVMPNA